MVVVVVRRVVPAVVATFSNAARPRVKPSNSRNLPQPGLAIAVLEPALAHLMVSAKAAVFLVVAEAAAVAAALVVEVAAGVKYGLL